jgi:CRISPR-associated endonuclease Cas1
MQTDRISFFSTSKPRAGGVYVADGYGISIRVERRHLVVRDGLGRERREVRLARATCPIKRLVVLGHTGFITLEALRWMGDVGVSLVHIDKNGSLIATSAIEGSNFPMLRRAQALAAGQTLGLNIARALLRDKLEGQAAVVEPISGGAAESIRRAERELDRAHSTQEMLIVEASAANAYWGVLASTPVLFARRDASSVPEHWQTLGPRRSPVSGTSRLAATPGHAIENYLYSLLEGAARIALLAIGLDPGIGILHADQKSRDSLALDVLEVVRPEVDRYVLKLLSSRAFRASDFHETRQGVCRLLAPLTHELAETIPTWTKLVEPVAERVARMLANASSGKVRTVPTHLTQANRSRGRDAQRRKPKRDTQVGSPLPAKRCEMCGNEVSAYDRKLCDLCLIERRSELNQDLVVTGTTALARLRSEGRDPAHGGEAGEKRGKKLAAASRERAAWKRSRANESDPSMFVNEILPGLRGGVSASELAHVTGLSRGYCRLILNGSCTPHARHWETMQGLLKT